MSTVMQSFIVSSKDKKARDNYIISLCLKEKIENFDISIIGEEGTIGIAEVRDLQKKIFLKPLKSKTKAIVIKNSENITVDAQNALLKILEEPPLHTIIILSVIKSDLLLPTILSRCKTIELSNPSIFESSAEIKSEAILSEGKLGERLKFAQDISKTKDEALFWLEKTIILIRQEIINSTLDQNSYSNNPHSLNILKSLIKTYTVLKTTNINPRFALEIFFLSLS